MSQLVGVAFLTIIVIAVIFVTRSLQKDGTVEDGAPMPRGKRRVLTLYLLIFGTGLLFMLVSLTSLDFPETPIVPLPSEISSTPTPTPPPVTATTAPTPTPAPAAPAATPAVPLLLRVFPQVKGDPTTTPKLALYGKNFRKDSQVRFNLQPVDSRYVTENLITVSMNPEYLVGKGSVSVDVVNTEGVSNAVPVPLEKPKVQLNVLFVWYPWVTREIQLLLLVIFAGALGSYLHAIRSLTTYIADRDLTASWFWWYMTRPFLGMAMGLVFYAVLRGGFLTGSPADAKVVNPFGVLAIGALVGMFSEKAAGKLAEVFEVVFRSGAGPEKLAGNLPLIAKLEPATIVAGGTEPVSVTITGERLAKVSKVRVNEVDRPPNPGSVKEKEVTFKLTPEDIAQAGQLEIRTVNSDGTVSEATVINVSEPTAADATAPKIASLEPATVAAGGKTPVGVKITGERLANVSTVKVDSDDRTPDAVSETEISFKLKLEDTAEAGQLEIIAANSDGSASAPAILTVTEPKPLATAAADASTATDASAATDKSAATDTSTASDASAATDKSAATDTSTASDGSAATGDEKEKNG